MATNFSNPGQAATAVPRRMENLALAYENVFTVIVRIRSDRQAAGNAEAFRANMRSVIRKAEQDAAQKGYSPEDVRAASFALVALLDESILNSNNPAFADWARRPLQEELFRGHVAGEVFFQQLDRLMAKRDAPELADLLEVYYLCLLLGYKGRYSMQDPAVLRGIRDAAGEKIRQIRGPSQLISPAAAPPAGGAPRRATDPWTRRLLIAGIVSLLLAVALFAGFKIALNNGAAAAGQTLQQTTP